MQIVDESTKNGTQPIFADNIVFWLISAIFFRYANKSPVQYGQIFNVIPANTLFFFRKQNYKSVYELLMAISIFCATLETMFKMPQWYKNRLRDRVG